MAYNFFMSFFKKLFFAIVFFILLSSSIRNILNYQSALKFYHQYKNGFEKEKEKNQRLKTEILKKTSLSEIEKTIRNHLNLLQPDEVALIIAQPTPSPSPSPTPSLSNFQKWLNLYQGKTN
jgi:hypothetical protein